MSCGKQLHAGDIITILQNHAVICEECSYNLPKNTGTLKRGCLNQAALNKLKTISCGQIMPLKSKVKEGTPMGN